MVNSAAIILTECRWRPGWLQAIEKISCFTYLIHPITGHLVINILRYYLTGPWGRCGSILATLALTLLVGPLMNWLIRNPSQNWPGPVRSSKS